MPADKEKSKEQLITELTALRATLAATEERLVYTRRFVENSPVSLILMKDGKCVDCNMAALPLFGLHSKDEIIGTTPIDFAPEFQPDGRLSIEAATNYNQKALEDGSVNFEWESVRRDGRHIMTYVRLVSLNLGGEEFLECVTVDITERKQAEEKILNALTLNQAILDTSPGAIIIYKASGPGVMANHAAARIVGGSREQLASFNFHQIASWKECGLYKAACEAIDTGKVARMEADLVTTFGRDIRIEAVFSTFDLGNERHLALLFNDITERREAEKALQGSEQRYRALYESSRDAIMTLEPPSWKFTAGNPTTVAMFRAADEATFVAAAPWELSPEYQPDGQHSSDKAKAMIEKAMLDGSNYFEWRHRRLDGEEFPATVLLTRVVMGEKIFLQATVRDITERERTEAQKKELEAQLRQSQKLETIGTMVGGIAHDFNNMMQPIKSCVEMMNLQLPADSPFFEYVNLISRSVDRGRDLVKQLLNFSRKREHEMVPLHMQQVVNETLHLLRAAVPATVEIHKEINTECGPVMADPINIQQIVMNLCANACDAMAGHGKLSIQLTEATITAAEVRHLMLSRPGNYLRLSISDTGHGMDEVTKKKIFDPFFTTKEVGKGTGLGLSVVHSIVVNHGGAITVKSEPGKGTEFHVYLPRCEEMPYLPAEQDKEPAQGGQGEVLFVDDEEDIVFIGGEMLESLGYNVVACSSHKDALREIEREPDKYGLVISDYSMPGMNGIQFAGKIREIRPDIPILFITGNEQAIPSDKLSELKVQSILPKPFDMKTLGVMVRKVLAQG